MSASPEARAGRPRASSRETLAEAACELFLEQGYHATSVADITTRAGVSRSSFFNYFSAKGDILWAAFDERLDAAVESLHAGVPVREAMRGIAADFAPDSLALAVANADVMGLGKELESERAIRQARLARAVADRMRGDGAEPLRAEVRAAGVAGAVLAAVWDWAEAGPGRSALAGVLAEALDIALGAAPTAGPRHPLP
nr:TetR/AcrR family transcriptional regulator [Microbacterium bovistercoris]